MSEVICDKSLGLDNDPRFIRALNLFNSQDWYLAHDAFEEIWHEINEPARKTIQGILQIAVAELHLERGNTNGATILYGEGLGRLRNSSEGNLGLDIDSLCECVDGRLKMLQRNMDPDAFSKPQIRRKA